MRRQAFGLSTFLLVLSTGCRHRPVVVVPVAAHAPVALEPTPGKPLPHDVASLPTQAAPVASVPLPTVKAKHVRHRSAPPPSAPPPVEVAAATPPPPIASVIGSLTTGEDASPAMRQHAADLIAQNDKRLKAFSRQQMSAHRSAITRVSNFDRDAMAALKTGDASGAITLATKAQVLLDDLDK